jgi:hypothetical protein
MARRQRKREERARLRATLAGEDVPNGGGPADDGTSPKIT